VNVFVTVGSMLPFDRLIQAMDIWAKEHPDAEVFAQIGETGFRPVNMEYKAMISPSEYRERFNACDVVVSHVGMGTVITASELQKPLVMLTRQAALKEHTNDHQLQTAKWLEGRDGLYIVYSETELETAISKSIGAFGGAAIETGNRRMLIDSLRKFISNH
jgi:UDP-N-acetylglucosamine transferase subunit ALG13